MKIKLRKPFFPPKSIAKIEKEIHKTLLSGQLTLGKNLEKFESQFAKFQKTKYACGVSSGTAGLHLSLLALDINKNDEVIVPAKTFISTANAVIFCNAKPIFCDVDEKTYQINPKNLKKLITKKTKAIIPVHLGGNVCNMKEILEITNSKNIPIVEDAAHAHGSTLNGKKAGSFGKLGVFSFYPDKVIASSDGGIITTNDYNLKEKLLLLRNVGRKKLGTHDFLLIGYNYRMNELQAILAREQLRILPYMLKKRKEIAKKYDDEFKNLTYLQTPQIPSNVQCSYYSYVIRLLKGDLNKFRNFLSKNHIATSTMFKTLYKTKPYVKLFGNQNGLCPISEILDDQTFTIPLHPGMSNNEVSYVIRNIKKFFN